jgi:D-specific alpha-keto acid dehydrogenase
MSSAYREVQTCRQRCVALGSVMPMPSTTRSSVPGVRAHADLPGREGLGVTAYGCEPDEAALFDELAPSYGVIPTTTSAAVSEAGVIRVPGNRCISVGHRSEISRPTLRALRDAGVELICTRSIGVDHIDVAAAAELGITVENVRYGPDGVADYTLMLVLMAIRGAKATLSAVAGHDFRLSVARGRALRDLTVGVVGVGHIGSAVVDRLHGFGCRVLACDTGRRATTLAALVSLDELLRSSDVVTLHVPLVADTHHLIGRSQIEGMKQGAVLVNTGRGALVDTGALVSALQRRRLGGAALDVLEGEEGHFSCDRSEEPVDHELLLRLLAMPNVIVTPHTAYYTDQALQDTVRQTIVRCLDHARSRADG